MFDNAHRWFQKCLTKIDRPPNQAGADRWDIHLIGSGETGAGGGMGIAAVENTYVNRIL
jgi:hypothetical protein